MNIAAAPVLLPIATAVVLMMCGRAGGIRRSVTVASGTLQILLGLWLVERVLASGPLVLHVGGFQPPLGVTLVIDLLSAIMTALTAIILMAAMIFGFAERKGSREHPLRLPLVQFLGAGVYLCFCTGDYFNLFVAVELVLIASYALLTLEATDRAIPYTLTYVTVNIVGGALFLVSTAVAYSIFGSLNFADMAVRAAELGNDPRLEWFGYLVVAVFGLKTALFPLFFWLPNSYPVLPYPLAALFAGTLTKVGAYGLFRLFGTVIPPEVAAPHQLLAVLAAVTLIGGAIGSLSRHHIRGILAFQIISHIGFIVLGLALFSEQAVAAGVFYMIHEIATKGSLFLLAGMIAAASGTDDLRRTGGLWRAAPWLAIGFLVQSLSLAGIPPFSGFWGKLGIITAALEGGLWWLAACALITSFLTLIVMLRIWLPTFWREREGAAPAIVPARWRIAGTTAGALTILSLAVGFGAEGAMRLSQKAARELLGRSNYIAAVHQISAPQTAQAADSP